VCGKKTWKIFSNLGRMTSMIKLRNMRWRILMSKGREDDAFGSDDVDEEEDDDDVEDDDVEEVAEEEDRSQDRDPQFVRVRPVEMHADISQGSMGIPTTLAQKISRGQNWPSHT
jgi:hypothetical protein